ncbi:MAG: IS110 family transposase [Planctomycetes bacterium]|nr:IS110 family transposase [Planctomycetota bacterium]
MPTHATVQLPTTIGLDLSDRVSHYHVLLGDGRTHSKGKLANTREDLTKHFAMWKGCRLVIEAGGPSHWISRLAHEQGLEVLVANPRHVPAISQSNNKSDKSDAQILAEVGCTDPKRLAPITHRSAEAQAHLAVHRARNEMVGNRTSMINHVRGVLKTHGQRAPQCSPESFGIRAYDSIPPELSAALKPLLQVIDVLNKQIKQYDKEIVRLGKEQYPVTQILQHIPGVGPNVSLGFVLTVDDPKRFKRSRSVGAYFGIVPRKRDSGNSNPQLPITKSGDREMRRLLVLSANYILGHFGPDCDLKRFGLRIAGDGTNKAAKKRARVAVARKLAVLMHHLWKTGEVYDPFYQAKRRGEPVPA